MAFQIDIEVTHFTKHNALRSIEKRVNQIPNEEIKQGKVRSLRFENFEKHLLPLLKFFMNSS